MCNLDWTESCEPDSHTKASFPAMHAIYPREFEVLRLHGVTSFPESATRILEMSQSAGRSHGESSPWCCLTITPTGRKYVTSRCRFLLGIEQLRLQHVWFDESLLEGVPNDLLCDLAGNAFENSCFAAVLFCSLALVAKAALPTRTRVPQLSPMTLPPSAAPAGDCSSDSDLDLDVVWRSPKRTRIRLL